MRVVLVTGTRDLRDPGPVEAELAKLEPQLVIHGNAPGVDAAADAWARARGLIIVRIGAEWERHGKSAGAIRNSLIVRLAVKYKEAGHDVVCLAMPGLRSVGTHDCGRKVHRAGIRVLRFDL
jgi:hypothetical protein